MKMLTIKEPFATLISKGIKKTETRSWKTNYRGEIYIHAGLSKPKYEHKSNDFKKIADELNYKPGYVLCKCNLIDCIYMDEKYIEDMKNNHYQDYICGEYSVGRYGWVLDNIEPIEPFSVKGKLGIWNYNR